MSGAPVLKKVFHKYAYPAAPLLSAALLIAAFPPFEQGYAAWFALLPLLWTCLRESPRRAFGAGFIFGIPLHLYLNFYLGKVLFPYLSTPVALAAMSGLVIYISLFNGLFSLAASYTARQGKVLFTVFAIPALWLMMECLRSLSFLAYNVGYLGYTQWNYPFLLNTAAVYGYWGLPFLMIFFQTVVMLCYQKVLRGLKLYAVASVFIILLAAGLALPVLSEVEKKEEPLLVSLIQGNSKPEQIVDSRREEILKTYLGLTRQAMEDEPAIELVAWPETVVALDFGKEKTHHPELVKLAEEQGISLLYGARIRENGHLYNAITLYTAGQEEIEVYRKHRLVPFVEYFPLEQLLNRLLQLDLLLGRYTIGEEITVFQYDDISLAGVICFESYFGDHTRLFAAGGAKHLFVLTNDAWFGKSIGLEQHAQVAAIRAAEAGIGVTQVANSGITISFDYRGRELFRSGKQDAAIFTLPLDMARRNTIYTRYGDYFPAFWAIFLIVAFPAIFLRKTT